MTDIDEMPALDANREPMLAAFVNLVNNAFKVTRPHTTVTRSADAAGARIYIEMRDSGGGLPEGRTEKMFVPLSQRGDDQSGVGLGLSIARQSMTADNGMPSVRNLPSGGCMLTVNPPDVRCNQCISG